MSKMGEPYIRRIARFWKNAINLIRAWGKGLQLFTERTLTHASQEDAERFRIIADFTYDWEYWVDPQGKLLYVSPACERITGYPPREFLDTPDLFLHITHPHDRTMIATHQETLAAYPEVCSLDFRIINQKGEERWIGHVCQPVFASDGRWLGRRASNRDITERKQAEETLRESEQRFKAMVQKSPLGIGIVDSAGKLVGCNQALADMVGYSQDALLKLNFADFTHPEDLEREWELIQEMWAQQTDSYRMEKRYIRQDGTMIWVHVTAAVTLEDEKLKFGFAYVEDITERKQAEEKLQRLNERFALATRAAHAGVWDLDIQKNELIWDDRMYELYGVNQEDFSGAYEAWLQGVHPDDRACSDEIVQQAFRGEREYDTEFRIVRPDGVIRWLKAYGQVTRDGAGVPLRMTGVNYDITERKQAEEALHQSEKELQLTLEATTDGIWKWNFVTNTLFFSPRYYTMLGYEPDEFQASYENWIDLIHPDDRDRALATATEYLATKPNLYENEFRLRTKRGDYRWVHSYARVVERNDRGEAVRMIGNHVDFTDRKQAEEALQESETRLRAATDASLDDFFVLRSERDAAGRIRDFVFVDLNVRAEKTLQLDRAQLIGKCLCEVLPINRTAGFFEKYVRVVETGVPLEEEFFLPDTHVPEAWYYHQVVRLNDGIAISNRDITERKQAEEKLKASLAEKEILLRELYHRTKNTMQVIRSMLMLQATRMPENEQVQQLVHDTELRILAMALVHDQLYQSQDLSRLNLGGYLQELSQQILRSDALAAQRIALTFDLKPAAVLLDTAIPCGLLLNELLSNALKHAFPAERTGTIAITLFRNEDGLLELHVADNGVGVPPDFDFRQQGSLGIEMIMALAEGQLHGTIRFTSKQGGVTCQVEFPDTFYSPRV